jgi:Protein of unknown function (DUF3073)
MGRGRAKAKQTKVARDLKYRTWDTDLDQLRRELSSEGKGDADPAKSSEYEADDGYDDYDDSRR